MLAAIAVTGCGGDPQRAAATQGQLSAGVVAVVGDDAIHVDSLTRIARAQSIALAKARELAVQDALFAWGARARFADTGVVAVVERGVLGRAQLFEIGRQARRQGPPSDAEVERITNEHWTELARPPSVETVHAVALAKSPDQRDEARRVAAEIAAAVRGIEDPKAFMEAAGRVEGGAVETRVEALPAVTADGRVVPEPGDGVTRTDASQQQEEGRFDERFAQAANAIERQGQQSDVVESDFGYHVILLVKRLEARQPSLEERRTLVADEVYGRRARELRDQLVARLRERSSIEVVRNAERLTALVQAE